MFEKVITATSDLTAPYQVLGLFCAMLALYVMQATWHDKASQNDAMWLQGARRFSFIILALGIAWSASYFDTHGERPSPPQFLMLIALTMMFFVRAVILHRQRAMGGAIKDEPQGQKTRSF